MATYQLLLQPSSSVFPKESVQLYMQEPCGYTLMCDLLLVRTPCVWSWCVVGWLGLLVYLVHRARLWWWLPAPKV